jgi:2-polyprenyl-6-methoxyphenol hydroxylase-like FAD-dependent oxidoreductase
MTNHEVVIAGAGPTGLVLAAELALAKIDVVVVERRPTAHVEGSRAGGLHAGTIEMLDRRGIAERFLSQGQKAQVARFGASTLDLGDFPTRHPYGLALFQDRIERILADWASELGVPFLRGRGVIDFTQDERGVHVTLSDGSSLRAQWLAGCDGGRSLVRKKAGIDFPGWDASVSYLIAEIETTDEPAWGMRRDALGTYAIAKLGDRRARVVLRDPEVRTGETASIDDVREGLVTLYGTDFGLRSASYVSRFTDAARQAATYRAGRVLLAGDAAHVHAPNGGQGLNIGVQDATNLGWKLAQVVRGESPDALLDTYHAERHPIAARVLQTTLAQTALTRGDARMDAVRDVITDVMTMTEPRKRYAAMLSGLDVRYDCGKGHALLGRRMPDLDVTVEDVATRVYALMHDARAVLLDLGTTEIDVSAWETRVKHVRARCTAKWELPLIGAVPPPAAVLIRPDGHVAWVGTGTDDGLREAMTRWLGTAS